jgi:hypothetical protein
MTDRRVYVAKAPNERYAACLGISAPAFFGADGLLLATIAPYDAYGVVANKDVLTALTGHGVKITATIDGEPIGIKKAGDAAFASAVWYDMAGTPATLSAALVFDLEDAEELDIVTICASMGDAVGYADASYLVDGHAYELTQPGPVWCIPQPSASGNAIDSLTIRRITETGTTDGNATATVTHSAVETGAAINLSQDGGSMASSQTVTISGTWAGDIRSDLVAADAPEWTRLLASELSIPTVLAMGGCYRFLTAPTFLLDAIADRVVEIPGSGNATFDVSISIKDRFWFDAPAMEGRTLRLYLFLHPGTSAETAVDLCESGGTPAGYLDLVAEEWDDGGETRYGWSGTIEAAIPSDADSRRLELVAYLQGSDAEDSAYLFAYSASAAKGYMAGGYDSTRAPTSHHSRFSTGGASGRGTFETLADLMWGGLGGPYEIFRGGAASFGIGGDEHVLSGIEDPLNAYATSPQHNIYDPATDAWIDGMNGPESFAILAGIGGGYGWAFYPLLSVANNMARYTPTGGGTWDIMQAHIRSGSEDGRHNSTGWSDGDGMVTVCGKNSRYLDGRGTLLNLADRYDYTLDSWATMLAPAVSRWCASGAFLDDVGYIAGGSASQFGRLASIDAWDGLAWASKAAMLSPKRRGMAAFVIEGGVFFAAGISSIRTRDVDRYDPVTDALTACVAAPDPGLDYVAGCAF